MKTGVAQGGTMRILLLGGILLVAGLLFWQNQGGGYKVVNVEEARTMINSDSTLLVLDVRTPGEFHGASGHLPGALLIPVQDLEARIGELEQYRDRPILAYCRTGNRSGTAAALLTRMGFTAINMAGGIVEWGQKGYPVEPDRR
jgi:rhodanese-related sulfurtransferase